MPEPSARDAIPEKGLDLGPGRRPVTRGDVDVYRALVPAGSMDVEAVPRSLAARTGRAVVKVCTRLCPSPLRGRCLLRST